MALPHEQIQPLRVAARRLNVPSTWLRTEAEAGRIPCLVAGRRILVHIPTVERILVDRATGEPGGGGEREP